MLSIIFKLLRWYFKWFWIVFVGNAIMMYAVSILYKIIADNLMFQIIVVILYVLILALQVLWIIYLFRKKKRSKGVKSDAFIDSANTIKYTAPMDIVTYQYFRMKDNPDIKNYVIRLRDEPQYTGYSDEDILRDLIRKTLPQQN